MKEFDGKVALVTGGAGAGIGSAVAESFAKEGAAVVVMDSHPKRPFSFSEELMNKYEVETLGFQCDVRNTIEINKVVESTLNKWGKIDILVNNAGIDQPVPVWEMPEDVWDLVLGVNLTGCFHCTKAVLPTMIKQCSGKIVNLSSIAIHIAGKDDGAAYVASKSGIIGLTHSVACQVAEYNINVNAVAPGLAMNDFLLKIRSPEYFDELRKNIPLKRDGTPQDMANAVLFLASEKSSYITGICLDVNGGWVMG